ncbi:MAG TPA: ABC transporter permease [Alphaproteobacteria bacterium]|nr:ABC transporter permease [Alphaproteobacteria bacterium]
MASVTALPDRTLAAARPAGSGRVFGLAYVSLVYAFFYIPIVVIILFAFSGRSIPALPLEHFTTRWFHEALDDRQLVASLWSSTWIALLTAVMATAIGMPAAMVLAWRPFRGKAIIFGLILSPIIIPQMVVGISLLLLFRYSPQLLGTIGIVIAHTTLTLCFSVMIFYSRLLGFRRSLIEAAMDLGASEPRVFFEVILPLTTPAILAVMLLTFTESFGEFIVAWFVAGFEETLPIAIWTSLRFGLSPKINAIATLIMIVSITLSAFAQFWILRQTRGKPAQPRP